jgi:hypothetical protein
MPGIAQGSPDEAHRTAQRPPTNVALPIDPTPGPSPKQGAHPAIGGALLLAMGGFVQA